MLSQEVLCLVFALNIQLCNEEMVNSNHANHTRRHSPDMGDSDHCGFIPVTLTIVAAIIQHYPL